MSVHGPASSRDARSMMVQMSITFEEPMEKGKAVADVAGGEEVPGEGDEQAQVQGGYVEHHQRNSLTSSEAAGEKSREQEKPGGYLQIPPDFRCPLSLELMSDPVIVASGQTYERAYIQQWLEKGNTTCPKTRQALSHTNLIPNYTVKALIANWCEAHDVPLPEPTNAVLRPFALSPPEANGEAEERSSSTGRAPSPPPPMPVQHEPINIPSRPVESRSKSMSSGSSSSRSLGQSRRTIQPRSSSERELDRGGGGFQVSAEDYGETSQRLIRSPRRHQHHHHHPQDADVNLGRIALLKEKYDFDSGNESSTPRSRHHRPTGSGSSVASSVDGDIQRSSSATEDAAAAAFAQISVDSPYQSDGSGELEKVPSGSVLAFNEEIGSPSRPQDRTAPGFLRRRGEERELSLPRIVPSPLQDNLGSDGDAQLVVDGLVHDLESADVEVHRQAAAELRLLAKYNMENRITIANSGAIKPLVALLESTDPETQENAVTALLNLSINDNNKSEIAAAGAINPLVKVLQVGNAQAMENSAATLFSLSVIADNKITIGASGAIPPLVHLLINGTPRGKKDAATALFNLSLFHENKARIVRAGAIKPLVELMADPAAGMVDKAVAVLANLATIPEGRVAIGEEGGIPALVEVVEAGSQRGKENAAAALLQLCMNIHKHRALVLQEGAIPPLVALSQSGTARAKEKASALLRHFREQRHQVLGPRPAPDRPTFGHYQV